jgi:hypothetical protein
LHFHELMPRFFRLALGEEVVYFFESAIVEHVGSVRRMLCLSECPVETFRFKKRSDIHILYDNYVKTVRL